MTRELRIVGYFQFETARIRQFNFSHLVAFAEAQVAAEDGKSGVVEKAPKTASPRRASARIPAASGVPTSGFDAVDFPLLD